MNAGAGVPVTRRLTELTFLPAGYGQGSEAVPSRRLVAHVLHALGNAGWHLAVAADLSKKGWDKDTLFFKPGPPRQRYFFSVSFNESDKVRLIDSPNPQVTGAFQAAVSVSRRWTISQLHSIESNLIVHILVVHITPGHTRTPAHPADSSRAGRSVYKTSRRKNTIACR